MEVVNLSLSGLKLIRARAFHDERGFFWESYREALYREKGIDVPFVQDNHSYSKKGTIRGMHYQRKPGQAKLVSVMEGEIFDVVVDIRPDSPTFKKWYGYTLRAENHEQLFIPVGFAHGFCVLSPGAHVVYKVSAPFDPAEEKGFRFDDPEVGIVWPVNEPILSTRDLTNPPFSVVCQ